MQPHFHIVRYKPGLDWVKVNSVSRDSHTVAENQLEVVTVEKGHKCNSDLTRVKMGALSKLASHFASYFTILCTAKCENPCDQKIKVPLLKETDIFISNPNLNIHQA